MEGRLLDGRKARGSRRSGAIRRLTVVALSTGLLITGVVTMLARQVVNQSQRALVAQRHAGTRLIMTSTVTELLLPLRAAEAALWATDGDRAAFEKALAPVLDPGGAMAGIAVLRYDSSSAPAIAMHFGRPLAIERSPADLGALPGLTDGEGLALVNLLESPLGRRVGFAQRLPAGLPGLIIYGELALPPPGTTLRADKAYEGFDHALYFTGSRGRGSTIVSTVDGPVTGERVEGTFRLGTADLDLVVSPHVPLGGRLAVSLPWFVLGAGLIMVVTGSLAIELIARRGDTAVLLSEDLHARSAELERAVQALRDERDVSHALMDSLPGIFLFYDTQDRFRRWNRNFELVTGYESSEIAQLGALDLFTGDDRDLITERIQQAFADGQATVEADVVAKDGSSRPFFFTGQKFNLPQGPCLIGVGIDVTERRRAEREIIELNATLEQRVQERTAELTVANSELDSFVHAVSHDLRGPLRAIDGFSLAVLEDAGDALDENGRRHLERVRRATARMSELIDDLLDLSQVTRAGMSWERVDLSGLARSVAEQLRDTDPERQVEFVIEDRIETRGDRRLLRIALENLLGNAWKFSRDRTVARIQFGVVHDEVAVYFVDDNGAGFDQAYVDKLFEPFQRLHGAQEFEGTGIGLATVARIIQRHRGRVWAEGAVGQGARVSFTCDDPREDAS